MWFAGETLGDLSFYHERIDIQRLNLAQVF